MKTATSVPAQRRRAGPRPRVTLGALVLLSLGLGLGGCGQKGPLTLPPASAASGPSR